MLEKNDFVELEYTGKVKGGEIFDTNIKSEAKKINLEIETRPLIICIGQNQILKSIDEFLIGKEIGQYSLELGPENAFGLRDRNMIKTMPIKIFIEKQVMPQAGIVFQFDTLLGKVSAVSGGRVIVDFNNPLANKTVIYELNIKRKVTDEQEKISAFMLFLFGKKLEYEVKEKNLIIKSEKNFKPLIEFFKDKFRDIFHLDLQVIELERTDKKEEQEVKK